MPRLEAEERKSILCGLEQDLGDVFNFCPMCSRLHRFFTTLGPTGRDSFENFCGLMQSARLIGPYHLGYHYVRLVMNLHIYGDGKGLPLQNLEKVVLANEPATNWYGKRSPYGVWHQHWSAKVIDGELYLSARHTLLARTERELHLTIDNGFYQICRHMCIQPKYLESSIYYSRPAHCGTPSLRHAKMSLLLVRNP